MTLIVILYIGLESTKPATLNKYLLNLVRINMYSPYSSYRKWPAQTYVFCYMAKLAFHTFLTVICPFKVVNSIWYCVRNSV